MKGLMLNTFMALLFLVSVLHQSSASKDVPKPRKEVANKLAKAAAKYEELMKKYNVTLPPKTLGKPGRSVVSISSVENTCPGYTTSDNRGCTGNKVCTSTYKPGGNVCRCGYCSAFTGKRYCQSGDIWVKNDICCGGFCTSQPVCGKCGNPCDVTATSVDVIPQTYPVSAKSTTPSSSKISSTTLAINMGANAQTVTVTFTFTYQVSTTITYAKAIAFSEKATAKVGIPLIGDTGLEFSSTQTFTNTNAKTTTQTATFTVAIAHSIPAYTQQKVTATGSIGTVIADVPVKVVTAFTCDKATTTDDNTMTLTTDGALVTQANQLTIEYGTSEPAYPDDVLPQATATCSSNSLCALNGLRNGNCCPQDDGKFNACCSFCNAKPACVPYAIDNTTMCCPSRGNVLNACCSK